MALSNPQRVEQALDLLNHGLLPYVERGFSTLRATGNSVEEASAHLREAVELFIETADPSEIGVRTREELYVTALDVSAG